MKKLLFLLLFATNLYATTITLNLSTVGGSTTFSNTSVVFELKNYGSATPMVAGSFALIPPKQTYYPNSSGLVTGTIIGNDVITPTNTYYTMSIFSKGNSYYDCELIITGSSMNLNNATCISTANLPLNNALSGSTSNIGGSPLTLGSCSSGNVTIAGSSAAVVAGAVIIATPRTFPGAGFSWNKSYISSTDVVTVQVCADVAGTPTASIYNVKIIR